MELAEADQLPLFFTANYKNADYGPELFDTPLSQLLAPSQSKMVIRVNLHGQAHSTLPLSYDFDYLLNAEQTSISPILVQTSTFDSNASSLDLHDLLDSFKKPEMLDDDNKWFCSKCAALVPALKTIRLHKTPRHLAIQLKRDKGIVNSVMVKFPI